MECVSTAIVVTLTLLGIGIVVDRLLWLRKWLNKVPPSGEAGAHPKMQGESKRLQAKRDDESNSRNTQA